MATLLDTTALSELTRARPDAGFMQWLRANSDRDAFVAAPSIGELEIGIYLLEPSKKRRALETWLQGLIDEFRGRILPFDVDSARIWGRAVAAARLRGQTLPATDSQIAAIASVHALAVVTRNGRHFRATDFPGLTVIDPWIKL